MKAIADAAARAPARRRHGRNLPAGQLTPKEKRFVDALIAGAASYTEAWTIATGVKGRAAQVGGSRAMSRPEVAAAVIDEAKRLRALGALAGMRRLVELATKAKSEYVQADVAKYLASAEGLGPRADSAPASGTRFIINIDLSEGPKPAESGTPRAPTIDHDPQRTDEQG